MNTYRISVFLFLCFIYYSVALAKELISSPKMICQLGKAASITSSGATNSLDIEFIAQKI
ncbi:MAG: hypothetical protein HQK51_02410 [Oligoflexia bacterium]|nr:hypothetical protein [Oligoflexia bacterium]